jgi:tetratricopeptide (TPR) repeat protein
MTVCENWFYFSMAGLLGMVGSALSVFKLRLKPSLLLIIVMLFIAILGIRTAIRGNDYSSSFTLSLKDVAVSKEDFKAYTGLSQSYFSVGDYKQAKRYAQKSIDIFPDVLNYQNLGAALVYQGNYAGAYEAYNNGLKHGNYSQLLDNLAELTLVYGTPADNQKFFASSLKQYPNDPYLWVYYALIIYRTGNTPYAKAASSYALSNGQSLPLVDGVYNAINNNTPITVIVGTKKVVIP